MLGAKLQYIALLCTTVLKVFIRGKTTKNTSSFTVYASFERESIIFHINNSLDGIPELLNS